MHLRQNRMDQQSWVPEHDRAEGGNPTVRFRGAPPENQTFSPRPDLFSPTQLMGRPPRGACSGQLSDFA
jgi:hypothetical protein